MRGGKAQQFGDAIFIRKVFAQAFLEHRAKLVVKAGVFAGQGFVFVADDIGHIIGAGLGQLVVFRQVFEHAQHAFGATLADGFDVAAFLQ